jgi:predicted protein tyrosine phosphatase
VVSWVMSSTLKMAAEDTASKTPATTKVVMHCYNIIPHSTAVL